MLPEIDFLRKHRDKLIIVRRGADISTELALGMTIASLNKRIGELDAIRVAAEVRSEIIEVQVVRYGQSGETTIW